VGPCAQAVISQQPLLPAAILTFVIWPSPGTTPLLRSHSCVRSPGLQVTAPKGPWCGGGGPGEGVLHSV
jgi:hypothetical protein